MARMTDYVVYRIGSNAANQPMRCRKPLAIVSAENPETACSVVAGKVAGQGNGEIVHSSEECSTVYPNQRLKAVPVSRARKSDVAYILECDAQHA